MAIRITSADNRESALGRFKVRLGTFPGGRGSQEGFTLVEIIIVIVIIAVLLAGAIPYMYDSIANSVGDRAADAITLKAQEVRSKAIETGEDKKVSITTNGITDVTLPSGWHLEVKGLNDSKFHAPFRNQTWNFSSVGICEPLEFRLSDNNRQINIAFDALTAQLLHDNE